MNECVACGKTEPNQSCGFCALCEDSQGGTKIEPISEKIHRLELQLKEANSRLEAVGDLIQCDYCPFVQKCSGEGDDCKWNPVQEDWIQGAQE